MCEKWARSFLKSLNNNSARIEWADYRPGRQFPAIAEPRHFSTGSAANQLRFNLRWFRRRRADVIVIFVFSELWGRATILQRSFLKF
jgi:hypothetical protein